MSKSDPDKAVCQWVEQHADQGAPVSGTNALNQVVTTGYNIGCLTTGTAGAPCDEYDQTQRLDGSTTVTQRQFYDGFGHLIETRTAVPGGQVVVTYAVYDYTGRQVAQSVPYFVTAYTGSPGGAAFSPPDSTQAVTTMTYDGLGRVTSVTDPLSRTTATTYQVDCGYNGDSACYSGVHVRDANGNLLSSVDA